MGALAVTAAVLAGTVSLAGSAVAAPAPVLSISDAQAAEGTFGTRLLTFGVTINESGRLASVRYRTQDETARANEDYDSMQGTLQFTPGETTKTIEVPIKGDKKVEPDEFFSVVLSESTGATLDQSGGVGTGTIENDDVAATRCTCKSVKLSLAGVKTRALF